MGLLSWSSYSSLTLPLLQVTTLKRDMRECKLDNKNKEYMLTVKQYSLANSRKDNHVLNNFISILEHRIAELEVSLPTPPMHSLGPARMRGSGLGTDSPGSGYWGVLNLGVGASASGYAWDIGLDQQCFEGS